MNNKPKISAPWIVTIASLSCLLYYYFAYYLQRSDFGILLGLYSGIFFGYYLIIFSDFKYKFLLGLVFRLVLLCQIPNLSQDFYRFIWDGRLIINGLNPYSFLPVDIVKSIFDGDYLIAKIGNLSAHNHSNYPPFNQLIFAIGAFASPKNILGNVLVFRLVIILADVGIYVFGRKILDIINLEKDKIYLYFLNPLIIIELTGNLHFEGVMMFFLCLGFYFFYKSKYLGSAVFIALAILTKLVPLMLLPFFIKKMPFRKLLTFYFLIGIICLAAFLPFFDKNLVANYSKTVGLWFTNFEFNASIYYVLREIGFWFTGYNLIGVIGKVTPVIIIVTIFFLALRKKDFFQNQFMALMIYFLLSTTIHPWYLTSMIFFGVFLNVKSIWIWSYVVILSYSAYSGNQFSEKPLFLFLEYLPVFGLFYFELRNMLKKTAISV
jgi:alpha-1,6-mannosyltransferase